MSFFNPNKTDADNRTNVVTPTPQVKTTTAKANLSSPTNSQASLFAANLTVKGNIISKGEIQIEGMVEGDITGAFISIEEGGGVTGNVIAEGCKNSGAGYWDGSRYQGNTTSNGPYRR